MLKRYYKSLYSQRQIIGISIRLQYRLVNSIQRYALNVTDAFLRIRSGGRIIYQIESYTHEIEREN